MNHFYDFLSGASMFGAFTAGLFFLKFWKSTKDRLFLYFGVSFWFMALERLILVFMRGPGSEEHSSVYLFRLVAFLLIIYAIIDKNRGEKDSKR